MHQEDMATPSWYEPAAIDVEHLAWLERSKEPVQDPELAIVDVRLRRGPPPTAALSACRSRFGGPGAASVIVLPGAAIFCRR